MLFINCVMLIFCPLYWIMWLDLGYATQFNLLRIQLRWST